MTERLKQLLDSEAHDLAVPPPPTDSVLRQGRSFRRRNRMTAAGAGLAAALVVGGSVVALTAGDDTDQGANDAAAQPVGGNAVFSYGNQVFYDGPGHQAEIDDKAVKSMFYTSAGVVVRHGNNPNSDGGGPQRFSLITPAGEVQRLDLVTEETVHASDVDQPYIAYGEAVDGELQVVVYDVTANAEEARVTVGPTSEGWFPVSIDGDTVYVQNGYENAISEVDWKAGTVRPSESPSAWEVADGRVSTEVGGHPTLVDASTGDVLLSVNKAGYLDLSPDGRYAQLVDEEGEMFEAGPASEMEFEVFDVATGSSVTLSGPAFDWGWTADGDMFNVGEDEIVTCDSATGDCTSEPFNKPPAADAEDLKVGGRLYES
ncbi:hypothetical protein [Nocardioides bizhenqiangii]|uniref:Uncharacterized protein n=1 Tax=Nocardioides bizhenqiangii TaxID=3095076 RepID=A0ABZ0ZUF0_9ACTN|nr:MULTISPECIES: hypothetical protein [unclassified Nocardioides]MDZ5622937.1 hypothetical protein [Nocardioides sp. HM23]WQQ27920.1 hypothetical protein SHK19_06710 [Nocardioides sp. HM61]